MSGGDLKLSVLDLIPVVEGGSAGEALAGSTELVRLAERSGYHRHWVAEHHSMPGIASSSPAVLIARLAPISLTNRLGRGVLCCPTTRRW